MKTKNILILIAVMICSLGILNAKTLIKWKALPVTKYWSRRAVQFDSKSKIFFYRPLRFEKMNVDVSSYKEIQVKVISKAKNETVNFSVSINGKSQEHSVKMKKNDLNYYFFEPLTLTLPQDCKEITIYTRNPNAYFRVFGKNVKVIKTIPASLVMKADSYKRIVNLISSKTRHEYYVADSSKPLKMTAKYNGKMSAFVRFLPLANKAKCKIDVYVNQKLINSIEYNHKISGEYKVNDQKVSVGKKIEINNLNKNDQIEIRVTSDHEVLVHPILKTGK